jgi:putative redox protein
LWLGYWEENANGDHTEDFGTDGGQRRMSNPCAHRAGKHEIVIDEPAARGGTDLGPTPIETMIASLLGCTNVILNRVAEKNHVEVTALSLGAEAGFDRRGVMLEEEVAVPFPEIRLTINLTTPATDSDVQRLKSDLGKFCPVSKVIRQSGTKLEEIWNITRA